MGALLGHAIPHSASGSLRGMDLGNNRSNSRNITGPSGTGAARIQERNVLRNRRSSAGALADMAKVGWGLRACGELRLRGSCSDSAPSDRRYVRVPFPPSCSSGPSLTVRYGAFEGDIPLFCRDGIGGLATATRTLAFAVERAGRTAPDLDPSTVSPGASFSVDSWSYWLSGEVTFTGGCLTCFADEVQRIRSATFANVSVTRGETSVFFRAGVVPPTTHSAATLAMRKHADFAARAQSGKASLWPTPDLVAEVVVLGSCSAGADQLDVAFGRLRLAQAGGAPWAHAASFVTMAWIILGISLVAATLTVLARTSTRGLLGGPPSSPTAQQQSEYDLDPAVAGVGGGGAGADGEAQQQQQQAAAVAATAKGKKKKVEVVVVPPKNVIFVRQRKNYTDPC